MVTILETGLKLRKKTMFFHHPQSREARPPELPDSQAGYFSL
jgi:hypothetical protein